MLKTQAEPHAGWPRSELLRGRVQRSMLGAPPQRDKQDSGHFCSEVNSQCPHTGPLGEVMGPRAKVVAQSVSAHIGQRWRPVPLPGQQLLLQGQVSLSGQQTETHCG